MLQVKSLFLGGSYANCYLITDDVTGKSALIDCPVYNAQMMDFIGDADLAYILLTHGHYDHILGVARVKEKYGCRVAISVKEADTLFDPTQSLAAALGLEQTPVHADDELRDNDVITLGSSTVQVLETPGHTVGSVCYLCENHLFTGDLLFRGTVGRTDLPGGDWATMKDSLRRISALEGDFTVYPGHDKTSTLSGERAHNMYLKSLS